jgi:hypothetical protein
MLGIGTGEALIIGAICCVLGGGGLGVIGLVFLLMKKNEKD